jgi:hypothetical protein
MNRTNKLTVLTLAALLLLPACQNPVRQQSADNNRQDRANRQQAIDNGLKSNSVRPGHHAGNHDPRAIPSVDRAKTRTTNEYGGTSYGLGSSVYSVIGSSGLHSQGLSSHLESRLSRAGLDGIRVFALDDMVILATNKHRQVAYRYDSLQQKLLGGTSGMSAIGPETGRGVKIGTQSPGETATHDNLVQAERWVRDNLGSVRTYTLTGPAAVHTIDRIRSRAGDNSSSSARQMSRDIQKLLQMAMNSGK